MQESGENEMTEDDKKLENMFLAELERLERSNLTEIQERDKLPKLKMPDELVKRSNRVLSKYLDEKSEIPEISDFVYAMGKAVASTLGIKAKEKRQNNKAKDGNRRERKVKCEMKELRQ